MLLRIQVALGGFAVDFISGSSSWIAANNSGCVGRGGIVLCGGWFKGGHTTAFCGRGLIPSI